LTRTEIASTEHLGDHERREQCQRVMTRWRLSASAVTRGIFGMRTLVRIFASVIGVVMVTVRVLACRRRSWMRSLGAGVDGGRGETTSASRSLGVMSESVRLDEGQRRFDGRVDFRAQRASDPADAQLADTVGARDANDRGGGLSRSLRPRCRSHWSRTRRAVQMLWAVRNPELDVATLTGVASRRPSAARQHLSKPRFAGLVEGAGPARWDPGGAGWGLGGTSAADHPAFTWCSSTGR
jgi:hypothetical protein